MKKYLALFLLVVMLVLTLTACTDDFVFIDKSDENKKNEQNNDSNTSDNGNSSGNQNGEENNNGGNGGDDWPATDRYPGWGSPIPLD